MAWKTLQNNFLGGEVSPNYIADVNDELAESSLFEATNCIVTLQKTITKRLGTEFRFDFDTDDDVRVWPVIKTDNSEAVAAFFGQKVYVLDGLDDDVTGMKVAAETNEYYVNVINDPTFNFRESTWDVSGTRILEYAPGFFDPSSTETYLGVFADSNTAILSTWYQKYIYREPFLENFIRQEVEVPLPTVEFVWSAEGFKRLANEQSGVDVQLELRLGSTLGGAELATVLIDMSEDLSSIVTGTINLVSSFTGTLYVSLSNFVSGVVGDGQSVTLVTHTIELTRFDLFAKLIVVTPETPSLDTPYSEEEVQELQFIQSPFDQKELIIAHPNHPVKRLYELAPNAWEFDDYPFVSPPAEWDVDNYPSIVASHQGRLFLSGVASTPETIWASESNNWVEFSTTASPVASESFDFTPTERGAVTFMSGHKQFVFGNARDEFAVTAESGILQPTDLAVSQQTSYGVTKNPQVIRVGNSVLLHSSGNRTLRLQRYDRNYQGFRAPDISLRAEHLGVRLFRRMFMTRDPYQILWCVMFDGSLLTMTFDDDLGVNAWTKHTTVGKFIDGCVVKNSLGLDLVVLTIERVVGGVKKKYLEIIRNLRDINQWLYLDSTVRVFPTAADPLIVDGLEHLNGLEVSYLTDGNYNGTGIVADGSFALDNPATYVDVGLAYEMKVTTLPEGPINAAQSLAAKKRYSKVGVRGTYLRPPIIQGQRAPDRSPGSLMNVPEPAQVIEDSEIVDAGTNTFGQVTVQEPLPVRLTLAAIFGKLASNEL